MKVLVLSAVLGVTSAHFTLEYPAARGFDDESLDSFPCGGQDTVSKTRTEWPLSGGSISVDLGHDRSAVQVLLGIGNDVGESFDIVLKPTFEETGEGILCLDNLSLPEGVTAEDGTNATIQVVTSGDPSGGLYNCADITFRTDAPKASSCSNGTDVETKPYEGPYLNANGTGEAGESASETETASETASETSAAAATPSQTGAATKRALEWGISGAFLAAMGFAVLL
ncbi:MAG: hypothetical protein M1837_005802 [Sclerophora amabilis]|nr:MAG: hypothetical protein M1837_005802 [Sclerophora amabilis]